MSCLVKQANSFQEVSQIPQPSFSCVFRVNDWLLKINDMDLTNKDRKQVVKAVVNGGGLINMVVRRRKSLGGRLVTPVHINLAGHKGIGPDGGAAYSARLCISVNVLSRRYCILSRL